MTRLVRSVANKTNNFDEIDKQMAYMVFIVEKDFHVGPITDDYPAMKFFNLFDTDNIESYNATTKSGDGSSGKSMKTMGG